MVNRFKLGLVLWLAAPIAVAEEIDGGHRLACPYGEDSVAFDAALNAALNEVNTVEQEIGSLSASLTGCFGQSNWDWSAHAAIDRVETEAFATVSAQQADVVRFGFGIRRWGEIDENAENEIERWAAATVFVGREDYRLPFFVSSGGGGVIIDPRQPAGPSDPGSNQPTPSPGTGGFLVEADERVASSVEFSAGYSVMGRADGSSPFWGPGVKFSIDGSLLAVDRRVPDADDIDTPYNEAYGSARLGVELSHRLPFEGGGRLAYGATFTRLFTDTLLNNEIASARVTWTPSIAGRDVGLTFSYTEGNARFNGLGLGIGTRF